jgi:hypothetical protein
MRRNSRGLLGLLFVTLSALAASSAALAQDNDNILKNLHTITTITSTLPSNQDVNPYGVALVKRTVGNLTEGHVLVSNFNNSSNLQGTGTTIVDIAPNGSLSLFAQIDPTALPSPCPGGVGLTTALVVLRSGWVIVGSLPTTDGTSNTAQPGCLIVLDSSGKPVETFFGSLISGPWRTRRWTRACAIRSGHSEQSNNRDFASYDTGGLCGNRRHPYRWSLNGPLGLTVAEGGQILTVNGGGGFITEVAPRGAQIAKTLLDIDALPLRPWIHCRQQGGFGGTQLVLVDQV